MPNWSFNEITMKKEDAEKYLLTMKQDEKGNEKLAVDFNKLIPMPESLNVTSGGTNNRDIYTYLSAKGNKTVEGILAENNVEDLKKMLCSLTSVDKALFRAEDDFQRLSEEDISKSYQDGKQLVENFKEHGATTWYDWRIQNWGTKWNACDTEIKENGDDVNVQFDTAWAPPIGVLNELAKHVDFIDVTHTEGNDRMDILEGKNGTLRRIPECTYELQGIYKITMTPKEGEEHSEEQIKEIFSDISKEDFELICANTVSEDDKIIVNVHVQAKINEYEAIWAVDDVANDLYWRIESVLSEKNLEFSDIAVAAEDGYSVKALTDNEYHPEEAGSFYFKKGTFEITATSKLIVSREDFDNSIAPNYDFKDSEDILVIKEDLSVSIKATSTEIYRSFEQENAEHDALWNARCKLPNVPYRIFEKSTQKESIDKVNVIEPTIKQKALGGERKKNDVDLSKE